MKTINVIAIAFVFSIFQSSCNFAPDMEWVPVIKIEKKFTGAKKEFHENGKLKSVINYKMDMRHGKCITYYESGKTNLEINYTNDRKEGPFRWYYPTGELYQEGNYKNNRLDGQLMEFEKNGKLKKVKTYYNGTEWDY
jgi:antitoxin component YwqK of YwqJK toxin-antitoxin module